MSSEVKAEYQALRSGAGILELSSAGILRLSGGNAVQFLNGLVSNDVKELKPGEGCLAAFPTLQGKLSAIVRIYNTGSDLLLELDTINRQKIRDNLTRFVPAGEFFVNDASDDLTLISLQGPNSPALIEKLTGSGISNSAPYRIEERKIEGIDVLIASHDRCGEAGFDLFLDRDASQHIIENMLSIGRDLGVSKVGDEAFEIARIEAGVPREGIDAGENYIILESGLDDAVSYTKGCYLGQEVIARIHWRGQPAKRLRGLLTDLGQPAPAGTLLFADDGRKTGEISSSTFSIALNKCISLAYVHRNYLEPGTSFTLKFNDNELGHAELTELPFVRRQDG